MPRYNIIHENKYMHFSSIIDEPLTNFHDKETYKEFYINEYSKEDWNDFIKGYRNIMSLGKAVECYNMNRKEKLTKEEFLQFYGFYNKE